MSIKPNQSLEVVVSTYSYDVPTAALFRSQEEAIQYIKDTMKRELEIDHENGHADSTLEVMEDEIFGMKLTTPQHDHNDEMCMTLAQTVYGPPEETQPQKYKLPQIERWKRTCLRMSTDEFNDICTKLYGTGTSVLYCMDGLWIEGVDEGDVDDSLTSKLSDYLDLKVTSIHIDDRESNYGVWIVYEE